MPFAVEGELVRHLRAIERGDKEFPRSQAKRQHFVARFVLDGFTESPGEPDARLHQLDLSTGKPNRVRPDEAASRRRFYETPSEHGEASNAIEAFLGLVETHAAPALQHLLDLPKSLSAGDRQTLSIFMALQGTRTPSGISKIESAVQVASDIMLETLTEDPDGFRVRFREAIDDDQAYSDEQIERQRKWMIEAQRDGRIRMSNARDQALGLMLTTIDDTAQRVYDMSWEVLTAEEGGFITSDHPLAMFDPTPRFPWTGSAWLSSPKAETTLPLTPTRCLLVVPRGNPMNERSASAHEIEEINLRTYGFAQRHTFARTQEQLTAIRRAAKKRPGRVARPRPNYQIVMEEADPSDQNAGAANLRRGWPRFLQAPGPDGRMRTFTYEVVGYP